MASLRSIRGWGAFIAVLATAGLLAAFWGGGSALSVGDVSPNVTDGVLTSLDIEVTNTSDEPATPVVDVFWGGWPVPWKVQTPSLIGPGETRSVRALPTSPELIPALQRTIDGAAAHTPFRVRVNARGRSEFSSSSLLAVPAMDVGLINPSLALWGRPNHSLASAPYGWTAVRREGPATSLLIGPSGSGKGVGLRVANGPGEGQGWAEGGLIQDVPALSSCYSVRLRYIPNEAFGQGGLSTGDIGLQFIQSKGSLWFVSSADNVAHVTDLPGSTRIVELPVAPFEWQDLTLDLTDYLVGSGLEIGHPATVKIFNSLLTSEAGPQELNVSYLAECRASTG